MDQKERQLFAALEQMGSVIVAYSGGADSAYLAWAATSALGGKAIAITADSASLPESHKGDAEAFAREHGIRHEYIATREFDNPDYVANNPDRCFHCKDELFTRLDEVARERGIAHVIYGVNVDDLGDLSSRAGRRKTAWREGPASRRRTHQSRNPRALAARRSHHLGSSSVRVPQFAHSLWNAGDDSECEDRRPRRRSDPRARLPPVPRALPRRYRTHRDRARRTARAMTLEMARQFTAIFKPLGFHYVTLDLEGYRQGSLNAVLS